jgi:methyl-accepting chemotaxis protein
VNFLNNLKTSVKLIGSFLIIAMIVIAVAVIGYINMKSINDGMGTLYFDRTVPIGQMGKMSTDLYRIRGDVYKAVLFPETMVKVQEEIPLLEKDFDENLKAYKSTFLIEEEVAELAILEPAWAEYKASVAEIFSLNKAGETEKIFVSINTGGRASVARDAVSKSIENLTINRAKGHAQGDVPSAIPQIHHYHGFMNVLAVFLVSSS